jgi:hypothetical protein
MREDYSPLETLWSICLTSMLPGKKRVFICCQPTACDLVLPQPQLSRNDDGRVPAEFDGCAQRAVLAVQTAAYLHLSGGASPMNPIQLPGRPLGPFDHGRARPAFLSRFTTS